MTVLVTGGAGFIGSHVCDALQARGNQVVVIDDFNDYYDPALKEANAERTQRQGGRIVRGDIRDETTVNGLPWNEITQVIHLAARAGVRPSIQEPQLYWTTNINGTMNLYEAAIRGKVERFVFVSSSSVYGNSTEVPFTERDPVSTPISPYAATKKAGELMSHTYHHLTGLPISCLRYFTVYGPRQRPEMAIHLFTKLIDQGKPISMFGDGRTRRDYTYVEDIVQGTLAALDRCSGYHIYNLGEQDTTTLSELIQTIGKALGKEPIIERKPMQPGDVEQTWADIRLAQKELDYAPKVKIPEGIPRFVQWYKEQQK